MTRIHGEAGVTLLEVLVVVAILGLSVGIAALNVEPLETPLAAGVTLTEGFFREARLSAIASTSAHRVQPDSSTRLGVQQALSCSGPTWTTVANMKLNLPQGVTLGGTAWSVCFSSRGISSDNVVITLQHDEHGSEQVEVLLGGTTRVVE
jgi:prepilin-type N-terminal cleavage/methylation domain-containing protein